MNYKMLKETVKAEISNRMTDTILFYMMEYADNEILDYVDVAIAFQEAMENLSNQLADELEKESVQMQNILSQ